MEVVRKVRRVHREPPEHLVYREPVVLKVVLVPVVRLVQLVRLVRLGVWAALVCQERQDALVVLELLVLVEVQGLRVRLDHQEHPGVRVELDSQDLQAAQESQAAQEVMDHLEFLE